MVPDVIETVMTELLVEVKENNAKADLLSVQLMDLTSQVKDYKQYLDQMKINVPPVDISGIETKLSFQQIFIKGELRDLKEFVMAKMKKKAFREQVYQWVPWLLVVLLCAIIFRIAIGGSFYGTLF